jgi:hypothetical protein
MYHLLPFGHILIISVLNEHGPYYVICVRRLILEQQLASSQVPREEQINLIKDLERKETEYMRLKRHRICVDDFDLLTILGKGAYGQVCSSNSAIILMIYSSVVSSFLLIILNFFCSIAK